MRNLLRWWRYVLVIFQTLLPSNKSPGYVHFLCDAYLNNMVQRVCWLSCLSTQCINYHDVTMHSRFRNSQFMIVSHYFSDVLWDSFLHWSISSREERRPPKHKFSLGISFCRRRQLGNGSESDPTPLVCAASSPVILTTISTAPVGSKKIRVKQGNIGNFPLPKGPDFR